MTRRATLRLHQRTASYTSGVRFEPVSLELLDGGKWTFSRCWQRFSKLAALCPAEESP